MSQEGNPSNFNGLILEISGKALIQNLYLEHINQHQIEIALPQLDNADRHIMLSPNASNPIDLSKYSSINIVEISQQPPAARQREDINLEPALARNQERLSDFYQSYKNEDSSIDWSKVATKITLSNTSGTFYDHEDKYTTGLKIEFSAQGVENIELRDGTTGETIATLSALQLPATMVIGNLCNIDSKIDVGNSQIDVGNSLHGTFCSPTFRSSPGNPNPLNNPSPSNFVWYLCSQCGVIYNNNTKNSPNNYCFGNPQSNTNGTTYSTHTATTFEGGTPMVFALPYYPSNINPDQIPTGGSGFRCSKCQAVYDPQCESQNCPSSKNATHTNTGGEGTFYWVITDGPLPPRDQSGVMSFSMCGVCSGLYFPTAGYINNACSGTTIGSLKAHQLAANSKTYSLTVIPKPNQTASFG